MTDSMIDRAAGRVVTQEERWRAEAAARNALDALATTRRNRRRAVVVQADAGTLRLRQPRAYLLFGRGLAWCWLGVLALLALLIFVIPWWGALLAMAPVALLWSWEALRLSPTLRVTAQGNVGVFNGLWHRARRPASDIKLELCEWGFTGWLGECVIKASGWPVARVIGLRDADLDTVEGFAKASGIRIERSKMNYSVTVTG